MLKNIVGVKRERRARRESEMFRGRARGKEEKIQRTKDVFDKAYVYRLEGSDGRVVTTDILGT